MESAIQLYTLRDLDLGLLDLVERVGNTAFAGVEFAGLGDAEPDAVAEALADAGLAAAAAHVGADRLEDAFDATVSAYETVGCDAVVVPHLDAANFSTRAAVDGAARRLSDVAARLDDRGFSLHYHNHDHEFVDLDGRSAFDRFVERTDDAVGLELDVGWAAAAGRDPAALLRRLDDRVSLVHFKDVDVATGTPVELGAGDVDLDACAEAARRVGADWLIYEHDCPDDPLASLEHGAAALADRCA